MTDTDLIQNLRRENEALRAAYHEMADALVALRWSDGTTDI